MPDVRLSRGSRPVLFVAATLSLAWTTAAILAVDPAAERLTSYAAGSTAARIADIAAGLGLVLAGALAWTRPHARRVGLLATLAGLAELAGEPRHACLRPPHAQHAPRHAECKRRQRARPGDEERP